MDPVTAVWFMVGIRAIVGTVAFFISVQMVFYAVGERALRMSQGRNGMQLEILTGQVRLGLARVITVFLLTGSAWLSWPFVSQGRVVYHWQQVVASSFVLMLMLIEFVAAVWKWRERDRLLYMAEKYEHAAEHEATNE